MRELVEHYTWADLFNVYDELERFVGQDLEFSAEIIDEVELELHSL